MRYLSHTPAEIEHMLAAIGVDSIDRLFDVIPRESAFTGQLNLPAALSESELLAHLRDLGQRNVPAAPGGDLLVFAGAGIYPHQIPVAVDALSSRGEFANAYTPYQPELSQGTLTAIFEFQTAVAELFGTEYANASMYDGASATAEAVLMAQRLTGRGRALISGGLHPEYAETCATYTAGLTAQGDHPKLAPIPIGPDGTTDVRALEAALDDDVACVVLQTPNFFGVVDDLTPACEAAHAAGALVVGVCLEPLALALMRPPGEMGADIVVGEGIGLAAPPSLGGPGVGLLGSSGRKALRQMPGRLVGETVDAAGRPGFVLTLVTREQHIRRDKATSNICTNHGLFALRLMIHLALLGRVGLQRLAQINLSRTAYARNALSAIPGLRLKYDAPFFNEFALQVEDGDAAAVVARAAARGIVPGVALGRFSPQLRDTLLVALNESHGRAEIDRLAAALAA